MVILSSLLGYLPAPYLYGLVYDKGGARLALFLCLTYAFVGMVSLIIGAYFRNSNYEEHRRMIQKSLEDSSKKLEKKIHFISCSSAR